MIIREMRFDDIAPVAELERAYSLTPWDENGLLTYLLREDALYRGIGTRLRREIIESAKKYGVTDIHLEVRESNAAAIHLYEKLGFVRDGIRKNYYTAPVENAVTMTVRQEPQIH